MVKSKKVTKKVWGYNYYQCTKCKLHKYEICYYPVDEKEVQEKMDKYVEEWTGKGWGCDFTYTSKYTKGKLWDDSLSELSELASTAYEAYSKKKADKIWEKYIKARKKLFGKDWNRELYATEETEEKGWLSKRVYEDSAGLVGRFLEDAFKVNIFARSIYKTVDSDKYTTGTSIKYWTPRVGNQIVWRGSEYRDQNDYMLISKVIKKTKNGAWVNVLYGDKDGKARLYENCYIQKKDDSAYLFLNQFGELNKSFHGVESAQTRFLTSYEFESYNGFYDAYIDSGDTDFSWYYDTWNQRSSGKDSVLKIIHVCSYYTD